MLSLATEVQLGENAPFLRSPDLFQKIGILFSMSGTTCLSLPENVFNAAKTAPISILQFHTNYLEIRKIHRTPVNLILSYAKHNQDGRGLCNFEKFS